MMSIPLAWSALEWEKDYHSPNVLRATVYLGDYPMHVTAIRVKARGPIQHGFDEVAQQALERLQYVDVAFTTWKMNRKVYVFHLTPFGV